MSLAADQATEVENNTLRLVTLAKESHVRVLKTGQFLLVAFPLALKLLSNFLLQDKSLESIITLLLGSREAGGEPLCIVFLLINETRKTTILALVVLNLDLKILRLFCKLLSECLEFKELLMLVKFWMRFDKNYLLFPALQLLDKEVVPLGDLTELRIHAALEVNEILPGFECVSGILVPFPDNFVQVSHRDLGHERLLDSSTKNGLHPGVSTLARNTN